MFAKSGSVFKSFSKVIVSMFFLLAIGTETFHNFYIRDLQIGLRVRDRVRVRFSNIKPVTFLEPSFFMLVLSRESSSWDEMGMCCDNVKPEN